MTATVASPLEAMVRDLCAAADAADGQTFASFFSPTATFRFGNGDVLTGRPAIAASTEATVGAIWPFRHDVDRVTQAGDTLFCQFTIVVRPPDTDELRLPCLTVAHLGPDDLIDDYRVHMDIGPALRR